MAVIYSYYYYIYTPARPDSYIYYSSKEPERTRIVVKNTTTKTRTLPCYLFGFSKSLLFFRLFLLESIDLSMKVRYNQDSSKNERIEKIESQVAIESNRTIRKNRINQSIERTKIYHRL